jgi:hypothetical protein
LPCASPDAYTTSASDESTPEPRFDARPRPRRPHHPRRHRELIRQLIIDSTEDHRVSGDFGGKFVRIGD